MPEKAKSDFEPVRKMIDRLEVMSQYIRMESKPNIRQYSEYLPQVFEQLQIDLREQVEKIYDFLDKKFGKLE